MLPSARMEALPASNSQEASDTLSEAVPPDSLVAKSDTARQKKQAKKAAFDSKIDYQASDSIVFMGNGTGFLYGKGDVNYGKMSLTADYIRMKMDSNIVYATSSKDSTGKEVGKPVFKDESNEFESHELTYNFHTKRGIIHHTVTKQGEGYLVSEYSKLTSNNIICLLGGKYTTCDRVEHPDFYLQLTKAKVKPKGWIVSGPAYLVVEDVPLPFAAIPFGYFPFKEKYSSGIIMPAYGDDFTRGFNLHNGGYYFAMSDYVDLALTSDIYTKGTWAINAASTYKKRYKYNGSFNFSYRNDVFGEAGLPNYSTSNSMSITWNHSQDAKSSPFSTLAAQVNFSTSSYNRNSIDNLYNAQVMSQNTKMSSVSYTHRFSESPFSLTANVGVTQRTQDSTINMNFPQITLSMNRIYPFKRKVAIGADRWYEKIALSYSGAFGNSITTKENRLLSSSFSRDWQNGVDHKLSTTASFNLLNYISISPTANYEERWYFKAVNQHWDAKTNQIMRDTTSGFYRSYNFDVGVGAQTTLYGFYVPVRKIFGDKVDRIRHVFTPSISFTYHPDFGAPNWGSNRSYIQYQQISDLYWMNQPKQISYSPFAGGLYGYPSPGKSGSVGYSFGNNIEMKVKTKSDTTDEPVYKVVSLIDNFSVSGSYNLAADSLNWSRIATNLRIKLPFSKSYTLSLSASFDPYLYGANWQNINKLRSFPKFLGTNFSQNFTFNNDTFKKKKDKNNANKGPDTDQQSDSTMLPTLPGQDTTYTHNAHKKEAMDKDGFERPQFKWSVSVNYGVQYGAGAFNAQRREPEMRLTHQLSMSGTLSPTPKWNINWSTAYDFPSKRFTQLNIGITRDMHCWTMSAQLVPVGPYTSYSFRIAVKSSLLQDLKYQKQSNYTENVKWQ